MAQVPSSLCLLSALVQINSSWDRMFNQQEVQILIGGVNSLIDLDDLRRHTNYGGLYDDKAENIVDFWNVCSHSANIILLLPLMPFMQVVNTFDQDQRRALLRFVTSCSRPPLL
jgi:ubiquitin-protein ligase E3 C